MCGQSRFLGPYKQTGGDCHPSRLHLLPGCPKRVALSFYKNTFHPHPTPPPRMLQNWH